MEKITKKPMKTTIDDICNHQCQAERLYERIDFVDNQYKIHYWMICMNCDEVFVGKQEDYKLTNRVRGGNLIYEYVGGEDNQ